MKGQDWPADCRKTIARRKGPPQNAFLTDPFIGEEAVGRFGARPVLANQGEYSRLSWQTKGNTLAYGVPDPFQQLSESLAKPVYI